MTKFESNLNGAEFIDLVELEKEVAPFIGNTTI